MVRVGRDRGEVPAGYRGHNPPSGSSLWGCRATHSIHPWHSLFPSPSRTLTLLPVASACARTWCSTPHTPKSLCPLITPSWAPGPGSSLFPPLSLFLSPTLVGACPCHHTSPPLSLFPLTPLLRDSPRQVLVDHSSPLTSHFPTTVTLPAHLSPARWPAQGPG